MKKMIFSDIFHERIDFDMTLSLYLHDSEKNSCHKAVNQCTVVISTRSIHICVLFSRLLFYFQTIIEGRMSTLHFKAN